MLFLAFAAAWWGISCLSPQHAFVAETDPCGWSVTENAVVRFENTDTVSSRTIDVAVRYGNDFHYDRLPLIVTTVTPEGYRWRDTVVVSLSESKPRLGIYRDVSGPFRRDAVLGKKGTYLFSFTPLIAGGQARGIAAVGVSVY